MKFIFTFLFLIASHHAFASTAQDCKEKIGKARIQLMEMMSSKADEEHQMRVKLSAKLADDCVSNIQSPRGREKKVSELKKIWNEFKLTRENELVPLILAGKTEEAHALALGIQKERMDKINSLIMFIGE